MTKKREMEELWLNLKRIEAIDPTEAAGIRREIHEGADEAMRAAQRDAMQAAPAEVRVRFVRETAERRLESGDRSGLPLEGLWRPGSIAEAFDPERVEAMADALERVLK